SVYFLVLTQFAGHAPGDRVVIDALVALGFGASLISIFARLGGGIFTKGADNGGDCAGMAADLFETYAVTVVATMVLASIFFAGTDLASTAMLYPLTIGAACVVTSIIGTFFVRLGANNSIMGALYRGFIATAVLSLIVLLPVTWLVFGSLDVPLGDTDYTAFDLYLCGLAGLIITGL